MCANASAVTIIAVAATVIFNVISPLSGTLMALLILGLPALLLMASYCAFQSVQDIRIPTM